MSFELIVNKESATVKFNDFSVEVKLFSGNEPELSIPDLEKINEELINHLNECAKLCDIGVFDKQMIESSVIEGKRKEFYHRFKKTSPEDAAKVATDQRELAEKGNILMD